MRTSKISEEQIIGFLRQTEAGVWIKEIGRKLNFTLFHIHMSASDDKCEIQFMAESSITSSITSSISCPGIAMGAVIRHAKWSQTTSPTAR